MPDLPVALNDPPAEPAPTLAKLLFAAGEAVEATGDRPFRLDAGDGAWLVETGKVEVFARPIVAGDADGARTHVATIRAGCLLLSLRPSLSAGPFRPAESPLEAAIALVAVGHPETRVRRLSMADLKELARRPQAVPGLARLVEEWVRELPRVLLRDPPPKLFQALEAGQEVHLTEPGSAARARKGVTWVRHLEGSSWFLGRKGLAIGPDESLLPVSEETWLTTPAGARLSCVETAMLLRSGGLWGSLARFHRLFLGYVALVLGEVREAERARLGRKAELDRRTMESAHARLASVLEIAASETPEVAEGADPLLAACRLVGEAQGLQFEKPPQGEVSLPARRRLGHLAASSRVRHRWVILRDDWWRRDNGPLLGFLAAEEGGSADRPVALLPVTSTRYELVDPRDGRRAPVDGQVAERLDGEAAMFYRPLPERPLGVRDLLAAALRGRRRELGMLALMGVAGGLLALLVPLLTGYLFGSVIPASDRRQLFQVTLALMVGALAGAGFQITRSIAVLRLSGKIDGSLQAAVWDRLMALPVPFFRAYSVGDLADRAMGVDAIRELLTGHVIGSVLGAVFSLFSFGLLFYFSWPLALLATALVMLLGTVAALFGYLQLRHQRELSKQRGRVASLLFGLIHGIGKLRVAGAEERAYGLWAEGFSRQRRSAIASRKLANLQGAWSAAYGLLTAGGLFAMVVLAEPVELTASRFLAFFAAFGQFQAAALSVVALFPSLLAAVPTYERLQPILAAPPEVDSTKAPAAELSGEIELGHVSFRYQPDGPPILDDVSFRALPGEFIALVGPSGAGKSTCLRLILGFETPEAGSIYFDGQDLPSLDLASVRRQIGVVLQASRPMAGDIFSNIVGNRNLTLDDAWEAASMAGLEDDIRALPMGMHTIISEDAGTFSGGQLQRLLIARAIVHRPRILLFDEATSALDNPTQQHVTRSLDGLKATRIVVAHRLSTIQNADRIYVMDRGRVVESGGYEDLVSRGGLLAKLVQRQLVS
jgi:ATP-binding cassette subfamily C protein